MINLLIVCIKNSDCVHNDDLSERDIVFITDTNIRITHGGLFIKWMDRNKFIFINASSFYGIVIIDNFHINCMKRKQ
jgi:hypothetical protein